MGVLGIEQRADAVELGAVLINDVWGLQKDPAMAGTVAATEAAVVITHNRTEKDAAIDIVADIVAFLSRSLDIAAQAGIAQDRIVLDPGLYRILVGVKPTDNSQTQYQAAMSNIVTVH